MEKFDYYLTDLALVCVAEQNFGKVMSIQSGEARTRDTNIKVQ